MKIIRLSAENVKRLRAVEITPDGNTVIIAGRNGQGKSSILDSIWYALGGGTATKDTSKPIRDGQTEARVQLDLGDLLVTRTWTEGKQSQLSVRAADGAKYGSPQSMLDALVGRLSFDPLAFAQQPAREQRATLSGLVDLPFDPDELDRQRAGLYEERTEIGRQARQLEGQLAALPDVDGDGLPPNEISLADLLARREAAVAERNGIEARRQQIGVLADTVQTCHDDIEGLEASLVRAREVLAEREQDLASAKADIADRDVPDVDAIDNRLRTLDETNRKVRARADRENVAETLATVQTAQHNLTEQIDAIDLQKAEAIASAKMPIDGLGFDVDGVTYQGVPFKQCSSAEQLRVSIAMAMSLNPQIRVIRIADGSLLDSENLKLIEEMADANDFQVWVERVDESGQVGVVIEDGAVREPAPA